MVWIRAKFPNIMYFKNYSLCCKIFPSFIPQLIDHFWNAKKETKDALVNR